jgi:hypothetical protein
VHDEAQVGHDELVASVVETPLVGSSVAEGSTGSEVPTIAAVLKQTFIKPFQFIQ